MVLAVLLTIFLPIIFVGLLMMIGDDVLPALKSRRRDKMRHALDLEKERTRQKELELEMFREQQKSIEGWTGPTYELKREWKDPE